MGQHGVVQRGHGGEDGGPRLLNRPQEIVQVPGVGDEHRGVSPHQRRAENAHVPRDVKRRKHERDAVLPLLEDGAEPTVELQRRHQHAAMSQQGRLRDSRRATREHEQRGVGGARAGASPSDAALLMLTGGTTGVPKAALLRHRGVLMAALQLNRWFRPVLKEWEDGIAFVFPPFHVAGNVGILGTALVGRNPAVLIPNPRDLNDLLRTIQQARPAVLPAVPTLYNAMLAHPAVRAGKVDFSSVKLCVSGSAPLLAETKRRFEQLTGGRIIEVYSLTEACMASVGTPVMGTYKEGAVGIPLPDVDVRIVDVDDPSQEVGPGEIGEIVIEAPQLMEGYWHNPEATKEMLRDGRLYTGDLGSLDGDGYLTIADRKKDLIKASGFQVWPREVEEVIATHPAVAEVGVAGVPM